MTNRIDTVSEHESRVIASLLVEGGYVALGSGKTLTTGRRSPYYVNLRGLAADVRTCNALCSVLRRVVDRLDADALIGVPHAANLLAMATAYMGREGVSPTVMPVLNMSKVVSGEDPVVHGCLPEGSSLIVIDDVITDGRSKGPVIDALRSHGYAVTAVLVVVDRCEGGTAFLTDKYSVPLFALCSVYDLMKELERQEKATAEQLQEITSYLRQANA